MKNEKKIGSNKFEQLGETQRIEKKTKLSFFCKKESGVKLLENPAITAAKVATFNDRDKVLRHYFATI